MSNAILVRDAPATERTSDLEARLPTTLMTLEGEARYDRTLRLPGRPMHIYRVFGGSISYVVDLEQAMRMHDAYASAPRG